jgi:hypothetical protein
MGAGVAHPAGDIYEISVAFPSSYMALIEQAASRRAG